MKIAVLGSCRQEAVSAVGQVTTLMEYITYPHYTKEILQMIEFCLFNNIPQADTRWIFRAGLLNNAPVKWVRSLKTQLTESDIVFIEIASKREYICQDYYAHHIVTESKYGYHGKVQERTQSDAEIMEDLIRISSYLKKPIVVVGHIVTRYRGARFELSCWLREICEQLNITYVDPVQALTKKGVLLTKALVHEEPISHFTDYGHQSMKEVYRESAIRALRLWYSC
jgi:hypothetical protein